MVVAAVCGGDAGRNRYGTEEVGDEMVGLSAAGAFPFGVKIFFKNGEECLVFA